MTYESDVGGSTERESRLLSRRNLLTALGIAGGVALVGVDIANPKAANAAVGAWGGYANGRIPTSAMLSVPAVSGPYLRPDAARGYTDLSAAFANRFGSALPIQEAYRDLARQEVLWAKYQNGGNLAAKPGTSVHGWGLACDFAGGVATAGSAQKKWMNANAPTYGWHPVGDTFSQTEPWHFEFQGDYTPDNGQQEDGNEEMAVIISASTNTYNGIWLAAPGYWHMFTGEEWTQFNAHGLRSGAKDITAVNDRDFDVLKSIYTKQSSV